MEAGERLTRTEGLKPGDVLMVAVELRDRTTGQPFWWKRFACVRSLAGRDHAELLSLKMYIDPDKDLRIVDFDRDVVTWVPPETWPQGVIAMRTKWITKGLIPLGQGD